MQQSRYRDIVLVSSQSSAEGTDGLVLRLAMIATLNDTRQTFRHLDPSCFVAVVTLLLLRIMR